MTAARPADGEPGLAGASALRDARRTFFGAGSFTGRGRRLPAARSIRGRGRQPTPRHLRQVVEPAAASDSEPESVEARLAGTSRPSPAPPPPPGPRSAVGLSSPERRDPHPSSGSRPDRRCAGRSTRSPAAAGANPTRPGGTAARRSRRNTTGRSRGTSVISSTSGEISLITIWHHRSTEARSSQRRLISSTSSS